MKAIYYLVIILFLTFTLFSFAVSCSCEGEDDDDDDKKPDDDDSSDDDASDDDDSDDDVTDDDDAGDDDDDNDDSDTETIILDDGVEQGQLSGLEIDSILVQGFSPSSYPVTLESVTIHVGTDGIYGKVRMVVYYKTTKGAPSPTTPVYVSDSFTFSNTWDWNDFDLSGVTQLQNSPITAGEFWVGVYYPEAGKPGISFDPDGLPYDNIWYYDPLDTTWKTYVDMGIITGGVLMIRPTVRKMTD